MRDGETQREEAEESGCHRTFPRWLAHLTAQEGGPGQRSHTHASPHVIHEGGFVLCQQGLLVLPRFINLEVTVLEGLDSQGHMELSATLVPLACDVPPTTAAATPLGAALSHRYSSL